MNKNDIRRALFKSQSPEEAAAILRDNGIDISDEDAGKLFDTVRLYNSLDTAEMSDDELNAVVGGRRDFATEGCAATVEPGSHFPIPPLRHSRRWHSHVMWHSR